jgi:hypothetical protein
MKEVGGIKVGIISVTGLQKTLTTFQTSDGRSIVIRAPLPFVRKSVDQLKGKVDLLVLLSHAGGVAIDEKIAEEVSGIDLIITGHSHTVTYPPLVTPKNQTLIVEAGEHGYAVGRLDLTSAYDIGRTFQRSDQRNDRETLPASGSNGAHRRNRRWLHHRRLIQTTRFSSSPRLEKRYVTILRFTFSCARVRKVLHGAAIKSSQSLPDGYGIPSQMCWQALTLFVTRQVSVAP